MAKQMDLAYAMANTILMFNASTMSSDQVAWMLGGLFGAILMAGALYTRITGI